MGRTGIANDGGISIFSIFFWLSWNLGAGLDPPRREARGWGGSTGNLKTGTQVAFVLEGDLF